MTDKHSYPLVTVIENPQPWHLYFTTGSVTETCIWPTFIEWRSFDSTTQGSANNTPCGWLKNSNTDIQRMPRNCNRLSVTANTFTLWMWRSLYSTYIFALRDCSYDFYPTVSASVRDCTHINNPEVIRTSKFGSATQMQKISTAR